MDLVAFWSDATNLLSPGVDTNAASDIFVHDRQADVTERVSVGPGGLQSDGASPIYQLDVSADGRFVAFASDATNLLGPGGDTNGVRDVFVYDRQTGTTERVSVGTGGLQGDLASRRPAISADGRFVAFTSDASNLLGPGGDTNGNNDIFVRDRHTGVTERVSVASDGTQAQSGSIDSPGISADGRFVVFLSSVTNLLGPGGDTNGQVDVFVHDRGTGLTERVNVGPGGLPADGAGSCPTTGCVISSGGRFVPFSSDATNLLGPGGDTNGLVDVFVHDREAGVTERVSVAPGGAPSTTTTGFLSADAISADGRIVAFRSDASDLLAPGIDTNGFEDIYLYGTDPGDPQGVDALLFTDGELTATVLEAIDATTGAVTTLCPSAATTVAAGAAAFLRPEAPMTAPTTPSCPKGSLNGDGDTSDGVVQIWPGTGAVRNLHCAATVVVMSPSWVGALVSEADEAADGNGDLDETDDVAAFHRVAGPDGTSCVGGGSQWAFTQQAADSVVVSDATAVLVTPESAQGASPAGLNGDGDALDRVLQVYDLDAGANTATLAPCTSGPGPGTSCTAGVRRATADFVVGNATASSCGNVHLVAFGTPEAAQADTNLNAVSNGLPTGDADTLDDVLQVYDAVSNTLVDTGQAVIPCRLEACDPRRPFHVSGSVVKFLTLEVEQGGQDLNRDGTNTQLVLQSFDFCSGRVTVIGAVLPVPGRNPLEDSDDSQVFLSPGGRCDLGVPCDPENDLCQPGAACEDDVCIAATGTCAKHTSIPCNVDDDCRRCILRQPGSCRDDTDCPIGTTCEAQWIVAVSGVVDNDDDGVPDAHDNCPTTPNTAQTDTDGDAVGDACDVQQCGNGMQEIGEACDDGNAMAGDGCSAACTLEPPPAATPTSTAAAPTPTFTPPPPPPPTPTPGVSCPSAPVPGCLVAAQAQVQSNETKPGREKLKLQWKKVTVPTTQGDFGDPVTGTTGVALCLYDDASALVRGLVVDRGGQLCAEGKPCWKTKGTKGYGYAEKAGLSDGINKIGYGSGAAGKGNVDAAGANNVARGLAQLPTAIAATLAGNTTPTIQVITSDGLCIGATMTTVKRDDGVVYQAHKK